MIVRNYYNNTLAKKIICQTKNIIVLKSDKEFLS